jgi:hypothetical protein
VARSDLPVSSTASLVDTIDHLLNRGAVLVGETTLSLAGVDLVYVGLNLLISSVETLQPGAGRRRPEAPEPPPIRPPSGRGPSLGSAFAGLAPAGSVAGRLPALATAELEPAVEAAVAEAGSGQAESPERGLARLVLALVELLRQLIERQAVRRMEGSGLSEEEVERMGLALIELERKMTEMREAFGLSEADLNLDLGPLGRLLDDRR